MMRNRIIILSLLVCVLAVLPGISYGQTAVIQELEERLQELEGKLSGSASGFQFNGYARSGFLMTGKGASTTSENDGQPFRAPGAGSKWRLGNEADTYAELGFGKNWFTEDDATFKVFFMPVYKEGNDRDWVEYGSDEAKLTFRQSYAEAINPFGKGLNFWAGQRYYRRKDIHVTDFYYSQPVGLGGGVQDIPIGSAKMAASWINASRGDELWLDKKGEFAVHNIYADFYDITLGPGGLDIQASASWTPGGTVTEEDEDGMPVKYNVDSSNGWNVTAQYTLDKFFGLGQGGFGNIFLQYGAGTSSDFSGGSAGLWSVGDWNGYESDVEDSSRFRAGAFGMWEISEKWQMMPVLVYELADNGASDNSRKTWVTAGLRPYYFLTNHFALQFDYGLDYVDPEGGDSGILHKISFAPTIKLGGGFWDRPELRVFATYGTWSDEFKGQIGGEPYKDETSGWLYGMQMEAWW